MTTTLPGIRYLYVTLANGDSVYCPDVIVRDYDDTDVFYPTCGYGHTYTVIDRTGTPVGFIAISDCKNLPNEVWKPLDWHPIAQRENIT